MSMRVSVEYRRWAVWYPQRWRADNGVVMLGAYLDAAEAEGREGLTAAEKFGLLTGAVTAWLDLVVPGRVRDAASTMSVALLGIYGLITGVVLEWAPWAAVKRAAYLDRLVAFTHTTQPVHFGPFLSPFIFVAAIAVVAWVLSFIGPTWLYRTTLVATVIAGAACSVAAHFGWGHFLWLRGTPAWFAAAIALIALAGARPRRLAVIEQSVVWGTLLYLTMGLSGGWRLAWVHSGTAQSSDFFLYIANIAVVYYALIAVLLAALVLTILGRRTLAAAIVFISIPWAALQVFDDPISGTDATLLGLLGLLFAGYAAALIIGAITVRSERRLTVQRRHRTNS